MRPITCDAWSPAVVPGSMEELCSLFLIEISDPRSNARSVWHLLVPHPWYESTLQTGIQWRVCGKPAWVQVAGDLFDTTVMVLREDLERRFDLWLDRRLARDHFGGWLWRITRRHISKALRRVGKELDLKVPRRPRGSVFIEYVDPALLDLPVHADYALIDCQVDLASEVESLPGSMHRVARLWSDGYSVSEIAAVLGLHPARVRRVKTAALKRVRRGLHSYDSGGRRIQR